MEIRARYKNSSYLNSRVEANKWIEKHHIESRILRANRKGNKYILIDIPYGLPCENDIIEILQEAGFGVLLTKELYYKIVWDKLEV